MTSVISRRGERKGRFLLAFALLWIVSPPPTSGADPRLVELGRRIAEGAELPEERTCSRCHGALGVGRPEEGTPRLAGQARFYLLKQLDDFAAGARASDRMAPVARTLTERQREAVAAYYASLHAVPYPEAPWGDALLIQRGGVLSAIGDEARGIRACQLCHAAAGAGIAPSFPYLAGQYADYTARQLSLWQTGERRNDPLDVMAEIARRLDEPEIAALALYFARTRPPPADLSSPIPAEPIPPPPGSPDPAD